MIIFINGAFGVGKTTVAQLLVEAIPQSMLYDPEEIGTAVQNILEPIEKNDDFQHYPEWRTLTVEAARQIKTNRNHHLIIPMTIWRKEYFNEVINGLREVDSEILHVCLTASIETVHQRLNQRGEQKSGSWAHKQAYDAVPALKSDLFAEHLDTEKRTSEEIVQLILSKV